MIKAKHERMYMNMAIAAAESSTAERLKVGCVIVTTGEVVLPGYNGTPSGWNNSCETFDDDGNLVTKSEVLHAESNAISKAAKEGVACKGGSVFLTHSPCIDCAKLLHQVGIKAVYFLTPYRDPKGLTFLDQCKIYVKHMTYHGS